MKFFSSSAIFLGVIFLFLFAHLFYKQNISNNLSFEKVPVSSNTETGVKPTQISIPSINKNLPIVPSKITNKKWETTDRGVSFLSSTTNPGEKGNSVMYAHNWKTLLGDLGKVNIGDTIEIFFSNGKTIKFYVKKINVVDPSHTGVIKNSNDSRITLYTCTGFLDQKRLVVTATPEA